LGIAWAILQPVMTTAITSLVFGLLLKVNRMGCPIRCCALGAFLPWHLFPAKSAKKQREPGRKRQLNHQNLLPAYHHSPSVSVLAVDGGLFHLAYLALYRHGDFMASP